MTSGMTTDTTEQMHFDMTFADRNRGAIKTDKKNITNANSQLAATLIFAGGTWGRKGGAFYYHLCGQKVTCK